MANRKQHPPRKAVQFLRFYCKEGLQEEIEGDLLEEYTKRLQERGSWMAGVIYWLQVISFFRLFAIKKMQVPNFNNSLAMITHYLKVAFRNFARQRLPVAINILSLTFGIGCAILIYLFIQNEWSYDRFHKKEEQLYRINRVVYNGEGNIVDGIEGHPMPFAGILGESYPEILQTCRIYDNRDYVKFGNQLAEEQLYFVDSTFFGMFSFSFLQGDPTTALSEPNSVVVTRRVARRFFGDLNPIGQTISVFFDDTFYSFQISGVIENIPSNSTLQFDVAMSFRFFETHGFGARYKDSWGISFIRTFALLAPGASLTGLHDKTIEFCNRHFPRRTSIHQEFGEDSYYGEFFQPIREVHFDPMIESDLSEGGVRSHSYILGGIGLIILLIGCINFTILAIGRSARRVKEIGIRKVVGARSRHLRHQFLGESVLMSFFGLILGVLFAQMFIPQFNDLSNRDLSIETLLLPKSLMFLIGGTLITGLLAGLYPAFILSRFKPVSIMAARLRLGGGNLFTKSLVTLQFVLSTVLVLISLVMADQLRFMKHRDPGFEKDMLVVVQREGQEEDRFFPAFRNGLANHPGVLSMSAISPAFTHGSYRSNFEYEGRNIDYHITFIDTGFLHTMGIDMIAGRNFRSGSSPDSTMHILVNQAFIDALGWEDPIGREVKGLENAGYDEPVVIGVTDNFHYQSLEYAVSPMWMALTGDSDMNDLVVRIHPSNVNAVIRDMENIWKNLSSDYPFTYSFLDEDMAALYASEERWGRIIRLSGIFAVVIAFMGMYGLIALSLAGRIREMGLRKVLGASLNRIAGTLTVPFARLVLLAMVIALPVAWYLADQWLSNFAYHVPFRPLNVLLAFALIWLLFLLSVGNHIWKSSTINPAEILRREG